MPESNNDVGYYFALPRLLASWRGGSIERTEQNGLEAHAIGILVHAITFIFAAQLLLGGRPAWQQIVLLVPLALLVWAWWSVFFYIASMMMKLLQSVGLMREMPPSRVQSLLVCTTTTVLAWQLIAAGSWMGALGWIWIIAVALNLAAAALLALTHADPAR